MDQIIERSNYCFKLIAVSSADIGIVEIDMLTRIDINAHIVEDQRIREENDHREIVDEEAPARNESIMKDQKIPFDRAKSHQIHTSNIHSIVERHPECTETITLDGDMTKVGKEQRNGQFNSEHKKITSEHGENDVMMKFSKSDCSSFPNRNCHEKVATDRDNQSNE